MSDITVNAAATEERNKVRLFIGGNEEVFDMATLGLTFESSDSEILQATQGIINESLTDEAGDVTYVVRRVLNKNSVWLIPKPVAGSVS